MLVNNEQQSPFGAGWTLDGLERLHVPGDGSVVLTDGAGAVMRFTPGATEEAFGAPADYGSIPEPWAHALDDFDSDGTLDAAVPNNDGPEHKVVILIGTGRAVSATTRRSSW